MELTTSVREGALARLRAVQHYFDRRHLEAGIATLIEAARGHEKQGVPSGSPVYLVLNRHAESLVGAYAERWQIGLDQLDAELPVLNRLRRLAQPSTQQTFKVRAALVVLTASAIAFLLGVAGALVSLGYHIFGGGR
jgi:hypothetical protein